MKKINKHSKERKMCEKKRQKTLRLLKNMKCRLNMKSVSIKFVKQRTKLYLSVFSAHAKK